MIVRYNSLNRFEVPKFTLCNPGSVYTKGIPSRQVGMLSDTEAEEIVFNFNATSELSLRVNRVVRDDPEENAYTYRIFKALQNRRLIFVDDIGYFVITDVKDNFEGFEAYKDVKAKSVDAELQQKSIPYIENGTYKFTSDETGTNKGILEKIVETLPLWVIGEVDEAVANRWRTFEDVDTSLNCLSFLMTNVQDAYECIVVFDCVNRIINVYDQANYVRQTDIHITQEDFINSLEVSENADDLYTAISVFGDGDVTVAAINPLGTNVLYDFSHYTSWMSDELGAKVTAWQEDIANSREDYYKSNLAYFQSLDKANNYGGVGKPILLEGVEHCLHITRLECRQLNVAYERNNLVQNCLLKSVETLWLQKVLLVLIEPSAHIVLNRTALNNRLVVLVEFFLEIL